MTRPICTISPHVAAHLAGGYPEVTFDRLLSTTGNPNSGDEVELHAAEGENSAWGVWDADDEKVRIFGLGRDATLSLDLVRARLSAAIELRRALGLLEPGAVVRVVNAEGDLLPGLVIDAYGAWLVVTTASPSLGALSGLAVTAAKELLAPRGILEKRRPAGGGSPRTIVHGEAPPRRLTVHEGGSRFEVHLRGGANTGLFTDLRAERARLREIAGGKRALHTFSYSGTLSVALALGGAAHVTQVDLATGLQEWAARNLVLAGIDPANPERFRFVHADVLAQMSTFEQAGERFDLVLLDPPTYSAARPSAWSSKRHLPLLIERGARLIQADGGLLWLASTSRAHRLPALERAIEQGLAAAGRQGNVIARRGLPPDYPTLDCYPRGQYLKVFEIAVTA